MLEERQNSMPQGEPAADRGPWLATASGLPWYILDPRPEEVRIVDLAAGLSRACRYNGQLREHFEFLAVSSHSVDMTDWAIDNGLVTHREDALAILLHDGSEGLYGDMVTPIKDMFPEFRTLENRAQTAIMLAFGLDERTVSITKAQIKIIDRRIRLDERAAALEEPARTYGIEMTWKDDPSLTPLGIEILDTGSRQARLQFLEYFVACVEKLPLRHPELESIHAFHLQAAKKHIDIMKGPPRPGPGPMPERPNNAASKKESAMVFPVKDPFDNIDQATLRHVSFEALKRIDRNRSDFMKTCAQRPHLAGQTDDERRMSFGAQVMGAMVLSRARMMPGTDADSFLRNLATIDQQPPARTGLLQRLMQATPNRPKPEVKERMLPILSSWPGFDAEAYRKGEDQPKAFLDEFRIDFAGLREMTFEARKPFAAMAEMETNIYDLTPIHHAFERSAFAGIDPVRLEDFLAKSLKDPDHEAEPEPAP